MAMTISVTSTAGWTVGDICFIEGECLVITKLTPTLIHVEKASRIKRWAWMLRWRVRKWYRKTIDSIEALAERLGFGG